MKSMIKPYVKFVREWLAKSMGWQKHRCLPLSGAAKAVALPDPQPPTAHNDRDCRDRWARHSETQFTEELPDFLRREILL
jgi:hypothetical protein